MSLPMNSLLIWVFVKVEDMVESLVIDIHLFKNGEFFYSGVKIVKN